MLSTVLFWAGDPDSEGPGDSARISALSISCERRLVAVGSDAPQISQVLSEGWFWNVHRGHSLIVGLLVCVPSFAPAGDCGGLVGEKLWADPLGRFDIAAIAALTT